MAPVEKRKAGDNHPPRRRHKNLFEGLTEEEHEKMRKDGDEAIARIDAIMAAEAAIPSEVKRQNMIDAQRIEIESHLRDIEASAHVTVQLAPSSSRGSTCRYRACEDGPISPRNYRVALKPGLSHWSGSPDLFHVECFESLVDLSLPQYLERVFPEYQTTIDHSYILDQGAEQAVRSWIAEERKRSKDSSSADSIDKDNSEGSGTAMDLSGTICPQPSSSTNTDARVVFSDTTSVSEKPRPHVQLSPDSNSITGANEDDNTEDALIAVGKVEGGNINTLDDDMDKRHGLSRALKTWAARRATITRDHPDWHLARVIVTTRHSFY